MLTDADRVPLGGRAWIGDGRTGALVAVDGSIDWYCPGRFDAAPTLCRLLDPTGGAVRVGPVTGPASARRRPAGGRQAYRGDSLVVDTDIVAGGAALRVTDFFPWAGTAEAPPGRIVRIATAVAGPVDVEVEVIPGGPWGPARDVAAWSEGLVADTTAVRTGFALLPEPLDRDRPRWRGTRRLDSGESLVVTIDDARLARLRPLSVDAAHRLLDDTLVAWRSWLAPLVASGPYAAAVRRAALTLRSLTPPGGAPVAAPTTSLPRRVGGERTSDGRLVRWHDAAAAVDAFAAVGLAEEAEAAEAWLRRAVERTEPPWPTALDPDAEPVPARDELGLAGWRRSQPVVTGADGDRRDLDVHGDVVAAVSACRRGPWGAGGDGPLVGAWPRLVASTDWLADHWHQPDGGRWDSAGPAVRLVASAVQSWVALDGATRRAQAADPLDLTAAVWHRSARQVLAWLESDGLAADGGLQRDPSPAGHADAALLRVAWRGPWPARHPIVQRTVARTLDRLSAGLLVHRLPDDVDDGRAGPDSPDLVASLWAVRALAQLERWEEAHERMEAVLAFGGSLGLLADAADAQTVELCGNLPSAGTHLAVVQAALALTAGPR